MSSAARSGLARCGRPFLELLDARDGRQHAGDRLLGEDELERGLSHRDVVLLAQEAQPLHLLQAFDEPLTGAVAAVVVRRKGGLERVLVLQEAAGRGHARQHADSAPLGRLQEIAPRILLEHVVDRLHGRDPALLDRAQALVAPADRRPQGNPVVPDLSLLAEALELVEEIVALDRIHARVVQLVEVDVVGAEAGQARLERRRAHGRGSSPAAARPANAPAGRPRSRSRTWSRSGRCRAELPRAPCRRSPRWRRSRRRRRCRRR